MKRKLITAALPYVNNVPHLGNIIQVLSADCFARYCRGAGYETCYVCGTDEYGTATETRAAEEGVSPQELCDRYYALHSGIYSWFNLAFDKFGRTSTPIQTEIVQGIFKKLDEHGYIIEKTIEQLHCPSCDRFLADRYVRGICPHCGYDGARGDQCESCGKLLEPTELKNPKCSSCGNTPVLKLTKHLYIDLPKLRGKLEDWIKTASVKGEWAKNAVQMTKSWIRDGLHERAITRDLKWGIPVPKTGYENKVFYVWFDAPIGYVSITGNLAVEKGLDWKEFVNEWWHNPDEVELFQFIGKDNIPFHTVIFPSSQLGTGGKWTMLHHMSSSEYLNYEGGKFSKSAGVGIFGTDVMETGIEADIWRFYIYYNRPEKSDALFVWKDFGEKVNGELIGNLGNLVNRVLSFVTRYYDGIIPGSSEQWVSGKEPGNITHSDFWATVQKYEKGITEKLEKAELRDAFRQIFELTSFANKTFQDGEPWRTRKDDPPAAAALIGALCYLVKDIAILISPYMPAAAEKLAGFFGLTLKKESPAHLAWADLGQLTKIEKIINSEVLFKKLEDEKIMELREKYSGTQKERENEELKEGEHIEKRKEDKEKIEDGKDAAPPSSTHPSTPPSLSLAEQFAKFIGLRVAQIVKIERHPNADKLYIETLDIAGEERVIVSGLVPHYTEEELLNKKIIVAYNLKAAKLRGVMSKGMLLAASSKNEDGTEIVEVLDASDAPTGMRITLEGMEPANGEEALGEIDIDKFFSVPIIAKDYIVYVDGKKLLLNGKEIKTIKVKDGEVG